jgi:hypothetical protein
MPELTPYYQNILIWTIASLSAVAYVLLTYYDN